MLIKHVEQAKDSYKKGDLANTKKYLNEIFSEILKKQTSNNENLIYFVVKILRNISYLTENESEDNELSKLDISLDFRTIENLANIIDLR